MLASQRVTYKYPFLETDGFNSLVSYFLIRLPKRLILDNVFILPSFELIPHGNIDANGMDVKKVCSDVYELTFNERVTICEKNIQCRIVKDEKTILGSTYEEPEIIHADKYIVPDTYDYFIFDKNMITEYKASPIDEGSEKFLTLFKERILL